MTGGSGDVEVYASTCGEHLGCEWVVAGSGGRNESVLRPQGFPEIHKEIAGGWFSALFEKGLRT